MFSLQDTKQLTYWQEKRFESPYWYNVSDPIILVELSEIDARLITGTRQHEFQLQKDIYQQRQPNKHENVLMALSDALLRAIQRWIRNRQVAFHSKCCVSLHAVEPLALPMLKCQAVLLNIPVFAFYPWSTRISRNILAMMDALSFYLLLAKCQTPTLGMKLIVTVY